MKPWAHLDLMATEIGMVYLTGPSALYDLSDCDQADALAWALVRAEAPELSGAPASHRTLVDIWNATHAPAKKQGAASDLVAMMERGG